MTSKRFLWVILPAMLSFAFFSPYVEVTPDRKKEYHLIDSVFYSLQCNCHVQPSNEKEIVDAEEDGVRVLYKKGRVIKKGCFLNWVLECGVECEYTYGTDTNLVLIRKFVDGKYTGEVKVK